MALFESWEPIAGIVVGVVAILNGLLFRAGVVRRGTAWYWDETAPFYLRNLPFAQIPIGVMFVTGVFGAAILSSEARLVQASGWLLVAVAAAAVVVWMRFAYRPPAFLKPEWLRREEEVRGTPTQRGDAWNTFDRVCLTLVVAVFTLAFVGALWAALATAF